MPPRASFGSVCVAGVPAHVTWSASVVSYSPNPYDEAKRLTTERAAAMAKADEIADRVAAGDDDALWELLLEVG